MGRLDGKTAIITGGVSGIGAATSRLFALEGANVVMSCLPNEAAGPIVLDEIVRAGGSAVLAEADISVEADVKGLIDTAIARFGRVDAFISNAAAFDGYRALLDTPLSVWGRVTEVNLRGNFFIARNILPHMMESGGGALVFVASIAGLIGGHGGAAYTTTKHGLVGLCKQITFDYGSRGIRCNVICPGSIYTPLSQSALDTDAAKQKLAKTPYGTYGQPEFIAKAALYLASDDAEFVYGTTLLVDGGNMVRKW